MTSLRSVITKLGECEGNYGLDEEERDTDEDTGPEDIDEDEDALRASSPIPDIPPPKFFESIPVDEQFEYVKPVLIAMLQTRYEPARARHNAFMNAATRQGVLDSEHLSGDLRADELEELGPLLRRWIRRRRRRQALGFIPDDLPAGPDEVCPIGDSCCDKVSSDIPCVLANIPAAPT